MLDKKKRKKNFKWSIQLFSVCFRQMNQSICFVGVKIKCKMRLFYLHINFLRVYLQDHLQELSYLGDIITIHPSLTKTISRTEGNLG